jgi:D-alanyl-lipoteichoic acid acyltransferase DltB (MBOAT superfamily)
MIVFLVSGLWHGASWTFVIWGAIHGIYQVIGSLTVKKRNSLIEKCGLTPASFGVVIFRRVMTFILVSFAWLFFRANSISDALTLLGTLFTDWCGVGATLSAMGLGTVEIITTVLSILILTKIDKMLTYGDEPDGSDVLTKDGAFIYFVWIILFAWGLLLSKDMMSTFIYFQF